MFVILALATIIVAYFIIKHQKDKPKPEQIETIKKAEPQPAEEALPKVSTEAAEPARVLGESERKIIDDLYRFSSYKESASNKNRIEALSQQAVELGLTQQAEEAKQEGLLVRQIMERIKSSKHIQGEEGENSYLKELDGLPARVKRTVVQNLKNDALHNYYLQFSWNGETAENSQAAYKLLRDAKDFGATNKATKGHREAGIQAYELVQKLEKILRRSGIGAGSDWVEAKKKELGSSYLSKKVIGSLSFKLRDYENWQKNQANRYANRTEEATSVKRVYVNNNVHPNSLRHLKPSQKWSVYIDETGTKFDVEDEALSPTNKQLGRLVAVAVPKYAELPPLESQRHGSEDTAEEVDAIVQTLVNKPVGIFGFGVTDAATNTHDWFGHIYTLMRWVLLQLPHDGEPCEVEFVIEQNQSHLEAQPLDSIIALLKGEVLALDSQKYEKMMLSAYFMDKSHPYNGYPDAVAFTWGSPSFQSRMRLRNTNWLGHCLLRPNDRGMERLYLALTHKRDLSAAEWYLLCTAASEETNNSLLSEALAQLGQKAQSHPQLWKVYLDEVKQRLRLKDYRLEEVGHALAWLEEYAPAGEKLSGLYELTLQTARLAHDNHKGHVHSDKLQELWGIMETLVDEAPAEVCEALLRCAISATNAFEFRAFEAKVKAWAEQPIAIPGLLNHGKLLSTLGQLSAFQGQNKQALEYFDNALTAFERLSDPIQAKREMQQTQVYRYVAMMDAEGAKPSDVLKAFTKLMGQEETEEISRNLAQSGQTERFLHHVWLRTLVLFPKHTAKERKAYLDAFKQWQYGEDHPWPLIEAYRGWLNLLDSRERHAKNRLANAIAHAEDGTGPTLQWMAEVLRSLGQGLGVKDLPQPSADKRSRLAELLPAAPHEALAAFASLESPTHEALLEGLKQCLPFNFH